MKELEEIRKYALENNVPVVLDETADFLKSFVLENKPEKILEIGTAIGYSGSLMLLTCEKSRLTTIEKDFDKIVLAKQNFAKLNLAERVEIIHGDADEVIKTIKDKFDFVFLDGPKSHYYSQLPLLLNLLNKNGKIIADNVLFKGKVLTDDYPQHKHRTTVVNLRKFINLANEIAKAELLETGDGIIVISHK